MISIIRRHCVFSLASEYSKKRQRGLASLKALFRALEDECLKIARLTHNSGRPVARPPARLSARSHLYRNDHDS